jgi:hypothetical protein
MHLPPVMFSKEKIHQVPLIQYTRRENKALTEVIRKNNSTARQVETNLRLTVAVEECGIGLNTARSTCTPRESARIYIFEIAC